MLRAEKKLKLVFIGRDDGAESYFRSLVPRDLKKSIVFPGAVYGDDLAEWYRRASCFAFTPRYYEETSTAALEALSYGCPVVTVPESEIPFLSVYNAGIITSRSAASIRAAINKVLKNKNINTYRLIKDRYESDKVTLQLSSYMKSI